MNNIIREISALIKAAKAGCKVQREQKYAKYLEAHANSVIQAKEFDGKLYVAYNGEPIIQEDMLDMPIAEALKLSRDTWIAYHIRQKKQWQ